MTEEGLYQNGRKSGRLESQIKLDLEKKFDSIESDRGFFNKVRDDQEIYQAAKATIDNYITEIKNSKSESCGPRALEEFRKLQKKISAEEKTLNGLAITTTNENKTLINDLANRIDDAENIVIQRLALNRTTKNSYNANEQQKEIGKNYFSRERNTNIMTFQKDVNTPKIHEVLPKIGLKNDEAYRIDYTNCKDQNIKNKMIAMIGGTECTIRYNSNTKTYNIRGIDGKIIDTQRAYIYEGVTLTPEKVKTYQSQAEQKKNQNLELQKLKTQSKTIDTTSNFPELLQDKHRGPILEELKSNSPKLYDRLQKESLNDRNVIRKFLIATEQRLDTIVIDAKQKNWNLQAEPITKKSWTTGGGLMEAHLIARDGSAEQNIILFSDKNSTLGENLYNMIDGSYEEDYMNFLTSRITQKFKGSYDKFTKKENIINNEGVQTIKEKITVNGKEVNNPAVYLEEEKKNISDGLTLFKTMIETIKDNIGDTRDDDDREMEKMEKHLSDALYSIENTEVLSKDIFTKKILEPLQKQRNEFACCEFVLQFRLEKRDELFEAFKSGNKNKIISSIRLLGNQATTFGNTYTSHLADDIINEKDIILKDKTIDGYFQNISVNLELSEAKDADNSKQEKLIDSLYAANNGKSLRLILENKFILPSEKSFSSSELKQVEEKCMQLYQQLQEQKKAIDKFPESVDAPYLADMKQSYHDKKITLEAKTDKTEEDYVILQTYIALEQNPELLENAAQSALDAVKNQMKYANIDSLVKGTIGSILIDKADGLSEGENADIYNDIKGYGSFNLSDENSKLVGELGKMLVEEIAFTLAVFALTATTGVGGAALIAGRIALKVANAGGKVNKIRKAARMLLLAKKMSKVRKIESLAEKIESVQDFSKALKVLDKGKDASKSLQLLKQGEQGVQIMDKANDVKNLSNFGKMSQKTSAFLNKINPFQRKTLFADIDKMLSRGLLHQVIAKTYRGELDDSTSTWITDTLKSSGMYGILGVVARSVQTGLLAKLAIQSPGGVKLSQIVAEEGLMFGSDFTVDIVMDTSPIPTMEEIVQNIGIGIGAELLPYVGKIKNMHIGQHNIGINGKNYTRDVLLKEINDLKLNNKNSNNSNNEASQKNNSKSPPNKDANSDIPPVQNNKNSNNSNNEASQKNNSTNNLKTNEQFMSEINDFMKDLGYDNIYEFDNFVRLGRDKLAKKDPSRYNPEKKEKALKFLKEYDNRFNEKNNSKSPPNEDANSDIPPVQNNKNSNNEASQKNNSSSSQPKQELPSAIKNTPHKVGNTTETNTKSSKVDDNFESGSIKREKNSSTQTPQSEAMPEIIRPTYKENFKNLLKNNKDFSSNDYKNFIENQFSSITDPKDLNDALAHHLIILAQTSRMSANVLSEYRWGINDSINYAKLIQKKVGINIENPILKKYLNSLADGKILEYSDINNLGTMLGLDHYEAGMIGTKFLDSLRLEGESSWVVKGTPENPITMVTHVDTVGRQTRRNLVDNITETGDFNEHGNLDGNRASIRTNHNTQSVEQGIFRNGELYNGLIINNITGLRLRISNGIYELNRIFDSSESIDINLSHNSTSIVYDNNAINLTLSERAKISIVKIADYPELLNKGINVENGYCIVDREVFNATNGQEGFRAIRNNERIDLGRNKNNRFGQTFNDSSISRDHLTIYRDGDEFIISDHSTNGTRLTQGEMRSGKLSSEINNNTVNTKFNTLPREDITLLRSLGINEENYAKMLEEFPELNLQDYDMRDCLVNFERYNDGDFDKNTLTNILGNIKHISESKQNRLNSGSNAHGLGDITGYLLDGKVNNMSDSFHKVLDNSFNYANRNGEYCTASIPTFIDSITNNKGIKFKDGNGNIFYTKIDKKIPTSLKIIPNTKKVEFGSVSDLALKVASFVHKSKGDLSIDQMNIQLKQQNIPYTIKEINGNIEITSKEIINFQSVKDFNWDYQLHFEIYWGGEAIDIDTNPLFLKYSKMVTNLDKMNQGSKDIHTIIDIFKDMQQLEQSTYDHKGIEFDLGKEKKVSIATIDFDKILNDIENPTSSIRSDIRNYIMQNSSTIHTGEVLGYILKKYENTNIPTYSY